MSKIILGTAKFGTSNYGFSSKNKRISSFQILKLANELGIDTLDTSPRYGIAEKIIGQYHRENKKKFNICTKIDSLLVNSKESAKKIYESVNCSMEALKVDNIQTLYLHQNEFEIISDKNIIAALLNLKNDGFVEKIGVSIYSKKECEFAFKTDFYDVIQLPISILDSHIYSEIIKSNSSKEIIARSIFLQGLILNRSRINSEIDQSDDVLNALKILDELSQKYNYSLLDIAIGYVKGLSKVNKIIVGTSSDKNLIEIVKAERIELPPKLNDELKMFSSKYKIWGNPRNWRKPKSYHSRRTT